MPTKKPTANTDKGKANRSAPKSRTEKPVAGDASVKRGPGRPQKDTTAPTAKKPRKEKAESETNETRKPRAEVAGSFRAYRDSKSAAKSAKKIKPEGDWSDTKPPKTEQNPSIKPFWAGAPESKQSGKNKPYNKRDDSRPPRKDGDRPAKPFSNDRPYNRPEGRDKPYGKRDDNRPPRKDGDRPARPYGNDRNNNRSTSRDKPNGDRKDSRSPRKEENKGPYISPTGESTAKNKRIFSKGPTKPKSTPRSTGRFNKGGNRPVMGRSKVPSTPSGARFSLDEPMRLNKYMAHAGIASRRAADAIIANGEVTVNEKVVREMGYKVQPNDIVKYDGKRVKPVGEMVYILLNKPKDYITSTADEKDRRTVMDLVSQATEERIYPVGRLDRQTTGLILLTNDGELTQKLSHPSYKLKKIYHAVLDKPITEAELEQIAGGLVLEDGVAEVDVVAFADRKDKTQVGIELHIGKNRIVRRIFEHLGYQVEKLDRVYYAGLTKKDLPRGRWRYLTEQEIVMLKHFTGRGR